MSPTARTLAELRKRGFRAQVVERWNQHAMRRIDLFGFIDIVALSSAGIIGIQACTQSGMSSHIAKIRTECRDNALAWLNAGGQIQVWGWRKIKVKRGGKAFRWEGDIRKLNYGTLKEDR